MPLQIGRWPGPSRPPSSSSLRDRRRFLSDDFSVDFAADFADDRDLDFGLVFDFEVDFAVDFLAMVKPRQRMRLTVNP